jgi:hypothetical protein
MTDDEFYSCLYDANETLLYNYENRRKQSIGKQLEGLYKNKNTQFRGFRQT